MEKLKKYLDTIGVSYEMQTYGESYFPDAAPIQYKAICIRFSWGDPEAKKKETEIRRHMNRRKNLVIFREWRNLHEYGFCIAHTADREAHTQYRQYMDASIKEWEQVAHELYTAGQLEKVNNAAREIMEKYQKEYKKSLFHIVEKTA